MRIDYELKFDDLVAAAMRTYQRSAVLRRRMRLSRLITTLTLVGLAVGYAFHSGGSVGLLVVAPLVAILAAVLWTLLPRVYRDQQLRFLNDYYRNGEGRNLVGHYSLTVSEPGITVSSANSESLIRWAAVTNLTVADKYCYVSTPGYELVVPRRGLSDEHCQEFSQSVERHRIIG